MNRIVSGTVKVAGSLAVAGGVLVASAMPAGAVTLPRSWGAQATGTTSLPQVALAWAGNTYQSALYVNAPPILSTGFILDRAGPNTAYSSVTSPAVSIASALALVGATKVASTCDTGNEQDATIWGGTIQQEGQPTIHLPLKPADQYPDPDSGWRDHHPEQAECLRRHPAGDRHVRGVVRPERVAGRQPLRELTASGIAGGGAGL